MSLMGQMMHMPLLISSLLTHAARHNGDTEIVSKRVEGDMHRTTWAEVELRSRKLAQALDRHRRAGPGHLRGPQHLPAGREAGTHAAHAQARGVDVWPRAHAQGIGAPEPALL